MKNSKITLVAFALIITAIFSGNLLAGEGAGTFKAGYVFTDEDGNLGVNSETYNQYEGFGFSFNDFNYNFENGMYLKANFNNMTLNNRNLYSSLTKPGVFNLSFVNNQFRRIYGSNGDKFTRRRYSQVKGSFNASKNIKFFSSLSRTDKKGETFGIYRPAIDTVGYNTDYYQTSFKFGTHGYSSYGSIKAEYQRYEFFDDLDTDNDRNANALNLTAFASLPSYPNINLSGGFSTRVDEMYETSVELSNNQYWAGTRIYLPSQFKFDYRILYSLFKNRGILSYTDNWINTFSVTKGFQKKASVTVGYETRISDNHFDRTESNGFIFSGWARLHERLKVTSRISNKNKEVKNGSTILGDEEYFRHSASLKYTGKNWGNISFKIESKLKKNDNVNSEVDYSSYVTTLNLKDKNYGWISFSYAYYLGQFQNFSDETSFEFADNVLTAGIYPKAFNQFSLSAKSSYYRSHRDKEIEKFKLTLTGQYKFPKDHILEIKYNIYTFDDLMVVDNFYTGNIIEFNFLKGFNL